MHGWAVHKYFYHGSSLGIRNTLRVRWLYFSYFQVSRNDNKLGLMLQIEAQNLVWVSMALMYFLSKEFIPSGFRCLLLNAGCSLIAFEYAFLTLVTSTNTKKKTNWCLITCIEYDQNELRCYEILVYVIRWFLLSDFQVNWVAQVIRG